jgi:hypothetical protein
MSVADGRPATPWPVVRAAALAATGPAPPWLIDHLWTHQAVGVIGGPPKAGKTWLALELAVAVASGTPRLGAFAVHGAGPVLLYAAEDAAAALRGRLETLASVHHVAFDQLDVRVITADTTAPLGHGRGPRNPLAPGPSGEDDADRPRVGTRD